MPAKRKYILKGDPLPTKVCPHCKRTFVPLLRKYNGRNHGFVKDQKYCSTGCSNQARWGGHIDRHGYVVLFRNPKQAYEHRVEMERILGRELNNHETVHHKNGVRHDNRPENLELWEGRHGRGQRVADLFLHGPLLGAGHLSGALSFGA